MASSVQPISLEACLLITPKDCHEVLSTWRKQNSTFDAISAICRMKNELCDQTQIRNYLRDLENDPNNAMDGLLQLVETKRGKILYLFLSTLQKETSDYRSPLKLFKMAMYKYPCQSSELECQVPSQKFGSLSTEKLTADEKRLIICPRCDHIMVDPVLLKCLHSCCQKCVSSTCSQCDCNVEGQPHKKDVFVLNRIAAAAERIWKMGQRSLRNGQHCNGLQRQQPERLPGDQKEEKIEKSDDANMLTPPKCRIHNEVLISWCTDCNLYVCYHYASPICHELRHKVVKIDTTAQNVRGWIDKCLECLPNVSVTDNGDPCLPNQCDEDSFTQKYMGILTENKQRLCGATDSALEEARVIILQQYQELKKEAMLVIKQVEQAREYAKYVCYDDFWVFHQREPLVQQLTLLCLRTGTAERCNPLLGTDGLHLSHKDHRDLTERSDKRPLIECLPAHYFPVTQELVGRIKVTEADSPSHLFWDPNYCVKKETEKPRYEVLESELKNSREKLQHAEEAVKSLYHELDKQKKINEELKEKISSGASNADSDSDLVKNLRHTSSYVCKTLTRGEVDNVLSKLRDENFIIEEDWQNLKNASPDYRRAEELLDVICKKGQKCVLKFLNIMTESHQITKVVRSGSIPPGSY